MRTRGIVHPILPLRLDPGGGRAYAVGDVARHVFDTREGALTHSLTHDVSDWVRRSDAGEISVRVDHGVVRVARVAR